jgi:hypothetical protein
MLARAMSIRMVGLFVIALRLRANRVICSTLEVR